MAGTLGIEPRLTESKSVVLPLHNVPTKLVDRKRIELLISGCKPDVLPLALTARKMVETDGFEPPRFLGNRFTVCRNRPLCHVSKIVTHCCQCVYQNTLPTTDPRFTQTMCFNTLGSFVSHERLYPRGRPFAHVLSAG